MRPTRAVQIPLSSAASQLCDLELVPPTLSARDPPPTRTLQDVGWFSNSPGGGAPSMDWVLPNVGSYQGSKAPAGPLPEDTAAGEPAALPGVCTQH